MQLEQQAEEVLAHHIAHELSVVRVEVAHGPALLPGRRGEDRPCGIAAVGLDPEHGDGFTGGGLDLFHQFGGWQDTGRLFLHRQHLWVQRPQDLVLERHRRTGNAHKRQDQPGTDAEKPVQLEQGFLQHVARLSFITVHHGVHYAVCYREAFINTHKSPAHKR
ncbi:hypothetical protein BN844_3766 [Pseudomonas sp. SHC52]|nr:hypothetical protein BN844_3766 [Pseudomonas sp. SHC52]